MGSCRVCAGRCRWLPPAMPIRLAVTVEQAARGLRGPLFLQGSFSSRGRPPGCSDPALPVALPPQTATVEAVEACGGPGGGERAASRRLCEGGVWSSAPLPHAYTSC